MQSALFYYEVVCDRQHPKLEAVRQLDIALPSDRQTECDDFRLMPYGFVCCLPLDKFGNCHIEFQNLSEGYRFVDSEVCTADMSEPEERQAWLNKCDSHGSDSLMNHLFVPGSKLRIISIY